MKFANEELQVRRRLLGSLLKTARERVGMTQQAVAMKLSYSSPQFVSNWERGLAMPPMDVLPHLSKILAIPPKELIEALCEYQDELLKIQKERLRTVFRKKFPEVR